MYPDFKKFTLMDEENISIASDNSSNMDNKGMEAEEILKNRGHYYPMPRPYTNENVIESMKEYSSLQIKEVISEIEKRILHGLEQHNQTYNLAIKDCIEILNSKINGK
jgi:hypothetical protein